MHRSTLIVSGLMYADTGEFVCMYTNNSMSHLVRSSTEDTLYLYVKGEKYCRGSHLNEQAK